MADVSCWRSPLWQDSFCPTQTHRGLIIYSPFTPHIKLHTNSDCKKIQQPTKQKIQSRNYSPEVIHFLGLSVRLKILDTETSREMYKLLRDLMNTHSMKEKSSPVLQSQLLPKA